MSSLSSQHSFPTLGSRGYSGTDMTGYQQIFVNLISAKYKQIYLPSDLSLSMETILVFSGMKKLKHCDDYSASPSTLHSGGLRIKKIKYSEISSLCLTMNLCILLLASNKIFYCKNSKLAVLAGFCLTF